MDPFQRLDAALPLSGDERMILESVRQLARERIAPRAAEHDRRAVFPEENLRDINALGMNAMFVPQSYGGLDCSYRLYLACVREIAQACASTGVIWATNFHAMKPVMDFGGEPLRQRVLPRVAQGALAALCITEPDAGSDATGMTTTFTPEADEIRIDGGKMFITNGGVADFLLVFGKWRELGPGKEAISALVLEGGTPGLEVLRVEEKMGHHASPTVSLAFEGCRVPRENLLGQPGEGLAILFASLNKSRPSIAAHALGIARGAFEDSVAYINERKQFGRRVLEFQGVQFLLADLATELALCEGWLWHVARLVDEGATDFATEASMLKLRATDCAMRVTTEAVQLHGGYGYCSEYRVERLMRDAKITQIWEGTNQVHRQLIGRSFLRR